MFDPYIHFAEKKEILKLLKCFKFHKRYSDSTITVTKRRDWRGTERSLQKPKTHTTPVEHVEEHSHGDKPAGPRRMACEKQQT